jgi:hypothetical protein
LATEIMSSKAMVTVGIPSFSHLEAYATTVAAAFPQ